MIGDFLGLSFLIGFWILFISCPVCSAIIAAEKGRNVVGWALLGFLFGPIGVLAAAGVPVLADRTELVRMKMRVACGQCAELIMPQAFSCPHCQTIQPDRYAVRD